MCFDISRAILTAVKMSDDDRVVVLIDMDCFYCQVEEKLNPELNGKPIAVVQYNQWQGGGIIAVNYVARALGVTRHMRGDEAKRKCPDIRLPSVPCVRGKADISKYRDAGKDVAVVLQQFTSLLERASIDEAYLDITEAVKSRIDNYDEFNSIREDCLQNTYILGYENIDDFKNDIYIRNPIDCEIAGINQLHSKKLLVGAVIVSEIRDAVYEKTGFRCSAGIAQNKIMAKLVCGMNKPNKQTVLPKNNIPTLFQSMPVGKIKHLGGKFGELVCKSLNISNMDELLKFSEKELQKRFDEKNGSWLYDIARGIDKEPVVPRFNAKSIGCCKKFAGKTAILDVATLSHWLKELANEIQERLSVDSSENSRYPTQMVVSFVKQLTNGKDTTCSRSVNMSRDDIFSSAAIVLNAISLIRKESKPFCVEDTSDENERKLRLLNPIKFLGISVGKFVDNDSKKGRIKDFFGFVKSSKNVKQEVDDVNEAENRPTCSTSKENYDSETISNDSEIFKEHMNKVNECDNKLDDQKNETEENLIITTQNSFIAKYLKKMATPQIWQDSEQSKCKPEISDSSNIDSEIIDSETSLDKMTNKDFVEDSENSLDIQRRNTFSIAKFFGSGNTDKTENNISKTYCDKCRIYIEEPEMAVHNDYHFALSLKEEERKTSFEMKQTESKTIPKQTKTVKPIPKRKRCEDKTNSASIDKLFSKINNQIKDEICDGDDGKRCSECDKLIQESKFQEHLDHHEAKRLHMELNKRETIEQRTVLPNPVKKKKIAIKHVQDTKTISSFFQK